MDDEQEQLWTVANHHGPRINKLTKAQQSTGVRSRNEQEWNFHAGPLSTPIAVVNKVREALTAHRYHQALVRLRILAEQHVDGDTNLNRWDRDRVRATEPGIFAQFLEGIADDTPPTIEAIERAPLQLIRAIDEYLAQFSAQRSLPRPVECDGMAYDGID